MHPRPSPPLPNSRNRCSVLRLVSRLSPGLGRSSSARATLSAKSAFSPTRHSLHWLEFACGGHGLTGLAACDRATPLALRPLWQSAPVLNSICKLVSRFDFHLAFCLSASQGSPPM